MGIWLIQRPANCERGWFWEGRSIGSFSAELVVRN